LREFGRQDFQAVVGEIQLRHSRQLGDPRREASQAEAAQVEHGATTADAVANELYGLVDRLLLRWIAVRLRHCRQYGSPLAIGKGRRMSGLSER